MKLLQTYKMYFIQRLHFLLFMFTDPVTDTFLSITYYKLKILYCKNESLYPDRDHEFHIS